MNKPVKELSDIELCEEWQKWQKLAIRNPDISG
jgi:hypothetical protein